MSNEFKTTFTGGLAALSQMISFFVPGAHAVLDPVGAAALALFAWFAKDK